MKSWGNHGNLALYRTELRRLKLSSAWRGELSITLASAVSHTQTNKHTHIHARAHTHKCSPALSSFTWLHRPGNMTFSFSSEDKKKNPLQCASVQWTDRDAQNTHEIKCLQMAKVFKTTASVCQILIYDLSVALDESTLIIKLNPLANFRKTEKEKAWNHERIRFLSFRCDVRMCNNWKTR